MLTEIVYNIQLFQHKKTIYRINKQMVQLVNLYKGGYIYENVL